MRSAGGVLGFAEVSGDPDGLDDAAAECRGIAGSFARISHQLHAEGEPDGWSGVAAVAFGRGVIREAGIVELGVTAWAEGARVCSNLADDLREVLRVVERCVDLGYEAEAARRGRLRAAEDDELAATRARVRSMWAGDAASVAELSASPSAQSYRDEQAREARVADGHAAQAAASRRAAADAEAELEALRARARRAVEAYREASDDAGRVFSAIAEVAPVVQSVDGQAVASIGSGAAPGAVAPVLTRTAPPATERDKDDEGFFDGLRSSAGELLGTAASLGRLVQLTRPRPQDFVDPVGGWRERRDAVRDGWKIAGHVAAHPIETVKDVTYRPYVEAHRKGGWDYAAGFGTLDAIAALATGGSGKAAGTASRVAVGRRSGRDMGHLSVRELERRAASRVRSLRGVRVTRTFGDRTGPTGYPLPPVRIGEALSVPGARSRGHSWTTLDVRSTVNDGGVLGIPDENPRRFIETAVIKNPRGIEVRSALPLDGAPGGGPELLIPNPERQLRWTSVQGLPDAH